jgi:hypothetical protein
MRTVIMGIYSIYQNKAAVSGTIGCGKHGDEEMKRWLTCVVIHRNQRVRQQCELLIFVWLAYRRINTMAIVVVLCSLTQKKKSTSACLASLNSLKRLRQALHHQFLETKVSMSTADITQLGLGG